LKHTLLVASVCACFGAVAFGDTFTILPSRAAQNPTDIIDWSQLGPDGTELTTPQLVSTFNGNLALVGNINGGDFFRSDSGTSWLGNFDFGQTLIWTGNSNSGLGGGGPFAMFFQHPVDSFGFDIETDMNGPFTAFVQVLDPLGNPLGLGAFSGFATHATFDGSANFVGMLDNQGAHIGGIIISTDSGVPALANDFAIDDPSFTTPEPSSIALLVSGILVFSLLLRRKTKNTAAQLLK